MIVHVMFADKFIEAFIVFMGKHLDVRRHLYLITPMNNEYVITPRESIVFMDGSLSRLKRMWIYFKTLNKADKIIIHGLFSPRTVLMLVFQPWLLKKCYWVIWGGDLYAYKQPRSDWRLKKNEWLRQFVIARMGHLVTYIPGDVDLAREWYGAKGQYHECFMYPSNLYHAYDVPSKQGSGTNLLVGNSGDSSNNHVEIFENILPYKGQDIKIYCPLSYGDAAYISTIVEKGESLFGDKFVPLLDFMPFEKYLELLGQVDIAIFAHKRQQAMGNTITLLGLGKKVYMREGVSSYDFLVGIGVKVFKLESLTLEYCTIIENEKVIASFFSKERLIKALSEVFK